jgi:hypothetical protein
LQASLFNENQKQSVDRLFLVFVIHFLQTEGCHTDVAARCELAITMCEGSVAVDDRAVT